MKCVWLNNNNNYYYYYRESTLHDIQYGLNSGHIVSELDPDAPSRQRRHLSELDEVEERGRQREREGGETIILFYF